jgi:hypothetical protein
LFPPLVSLAVEALLKGFSHYIQTAVPGGLTIAVSVYLIFDFAVITTLFAMIFKILPDVKTRWRDMWVGAAMTSVFFLIGKWALGLYLGSGAAASAYGAASSLITCCSGSTTLHKFCFSAPSLPRFTPPNSDADQTGQARRADRAKGSRTAARIDRLINCGDLGIDHPYFDHCRRARGWRKFRCKIDI